MTQAPFVGWRARSLGLTVALAAAAYLLTALISGWDAVVVAVTRIGVLGLSANLLMSLGNYYLRFARWRMYLRQLGSDLPLGVHWRIYLSGFALTTTPGKSGEAIRAIFLKPFGVAWGDTLAAMFSERLSDLLAVLLLSLLGLSLYPKAQPLVFLGFVAILMALTIMSRQRWIHRMQLCCERGHGRIYRGLRHVADALLKARRCHSPKLLLWATLLSLAAWGAEALGFSLVVMFSGIPMSTRIAMFIYACSMLAGAISFTPGGLGGAEAAMVGLLVWRGAETSTAVEVTLLTRVATLWFAVLLGLLVLPGLQRMESKQ